MPRTVQNENPPFVIERAQRENARRANEARRVLGLIERDLEDDPTCVHEGLLDLIIGCCHLVQGRSAGLDLNELVQQAQKAFRIEIEQANRSVTWHDEDERRPEARSSEEQ
jgi:hypothetical protein